MRVHELLCDLEILDEFVEEVGDRLSAARREVALITADAANDNGWEDLRRHLHTLKGSSGWVGLDEISAICQEREALVSRARLDSSTAGPRAEVLAAAIGELGDRVATIEKAARGDGEYGESDAFTAIRARIRSA